MLPQVLIYQRFRCHLATLDSTCPCLALENKALTARPKSGVIKSVIVCDDPENEALSGVVSAWPSLPSNIREAVLLLVRQHAPQSLETVCD